MKPSRNWQDVVRDVERETNPVRLRALAHELNEAMLTEEREKVEQRIQSLHALQPKRAA
jgi:hypothetical protein